MVAKNSRIELVYLRKIAKESRREKKLVYSVLTICYISINIFLQTYLKSVKKITFKIICSN